MNDSRFDKLHDETKLVFSHIDKIWKAQMNSWVNLKVEEAQQERPGERKFVQKVWRPKEAARGLYIGETYTSFCGKVVLHCSQQ